METIFKCKLCPGLETRFAPNMLPTHIRLQHLHDCDFINCGQCDFKTFSWRYMCFHAAKTSHKIGQCKFDSRKFVGSAFEFRRYLAYVMDSADHQEMAEDSESLISEDILRKIYSANSRRANLEIKLERGVVANNETGGKVVNVINNNVTTVVTEGFNMNGNDIAFLRRNLPPISNLTNSVNDNYCASVINNAEDFNDNDSDVVFLERFDHPNVNLTNGLNLAKKSKIPKRLMKKKRITCPKKSAVKIIKKNSVGLANKSESSAPLPAMQVTSEEVAETTKGENQQRRIVSRTRKNNEDGKGEKCERKNFSMRFYRCQLCRQSFRPYNLKPHAQTHWTAKMWACRKCDFTAIDVVSVVIHVNKKHAGNIVQIKRPKLLIDRTKFEKLLAMKVEQCFPKNE